MKLITSFAASFAIGAALVGASFAPAAFAEGTTVAVKYSDLDLSSAKGQKALKSRITYAARSACGERSGPMTPAERTFIDTCITKAKTDAFASLQAEQSTQMAALSSTVTAR